MSHHPKHPDKDLRKLCDEADDKGWTITKSKGAAYFKMHCPCPLKHKTMIHLTPDPYYGNHKRQWLRNHTCWEEAT